MSQLLHGTVYTQAELIENGSKDLCIRYRLNKESAILAYQLQGLLKTFETKKKLKQAIKKNPEDFSEEVKTYFRSANNFTSPTHNRYLYLAGKNEGIVNVDRNCEFLREKLQKNGNTWDEEVVNGGRKKLGLSIFSQEKSVTLLTKIIK